MHDLLAVPQLFDFETHAAFAGGPSPDDILDDIEFAPALRGKGEPFRCVDEKLGSSRWGRVGVPVMWLLGAADNGAPIQRAWDTERPGAVSVLAGDGCRYGVTDEACLAWTS